MTAVKNDDSDSKYTIVLSVLQAATMVLGYKAYWKQNTNYFTCFLILLIIWIIVSVLLFVKTMNYVLIAEIIITIILTDRTARLRSVLIGKFWI